jgi:DNA modification methylase
VSVRILIGDCVERMRELPDNSVDSVVCDPPYHLTSIVKRFGAANAAPAQVGKTGAYARASKGFMGQTWDGGDVAFQAETWAEVLRVLKPGGHLVAFSGTRTYHRMAVAIEDAGFEVRDMIAWHYGSGFPKSHDISKAIDRAAGAEREVVGRRTDGRYAYEFNGTANRPTGGRSGSEEAERIGGFVSDKGAITAPATDAAREWEGWGTALKPATEPICLARKPLSEKSIAANVLKWGTGALNIDGCRIEGAGNKTFDRDAGDRSREQYRTGTTVGASKPTDLGRWPANLCHDGSDEVLAGFPETESGQPLGRPHTTKRGATVFGEKTSGLNGEYMHSGFGDSGSAARFFYCAKATTEERGEGNVHPTVKPVALMRWLVRLVTPKGGTVLDPFMGSGSTLIAADAEQFNAIGCELSPEYAAIAERRIRDAAGMFADVAIADRNPTGGDAKQAPSRSDESGGGEANRQRDAA